MPAANMSLVSPSLVRLFLQHRRREFNVLSACIVQRPEHSNFTRPTRSPCSGMQMHGSKFLWKIPGNWWIVSPLLVMIPTETAPPPDDVLSFSADSSLEEALQ